MITVFGLKNCDTCRKARKWLEAEDLAHAFKDVREEGVEEEKIAAWASAVGWEALLNRRGTTWRKLPEADKENMDEKKAIRLMARHPALIKRPVFETGSACLVGFTENEKTALSGRSRKAV